MKKPDTRLKVVLMAWQDAAARTDLWAGAMDDEELGCMQISVGFLVRKDRKWVVLAQSRTDEGIFSDYLMVPRCLVKKMILVKARG